MASSDDKRDTHIGHLAVGQVAAAKLRTLLETVWTELQAACTMPEHAEHVHQLRVATRRAIAALHAFRPVIPTARSKWFQKRLRRLRRAAGEARDLDVLTAGVARSGAAPAHGRLIRMLSKQRRSACAPIRSQRDLLVAARWAARVERLLAGIRRRRRRRRRGFTHFAARRLEPMVNSFLEHADRRLREEDEIHALRIAGKKLRYALETFAPPLASRSLTRCRRSLEQLQEKLGAFTDHASAAERFARWARSTNAASDRDALVSSRIAESRRADAALKAFSQWWTASRRRTVRSHFEKMLARLA